MWNARRYWPCRLSQIPHYFPRYTLNYFTIMILSSKLSSYFILLGDKANLFQSANLVAKMASSNASSSSALPIVQKQPTSETESTQERVSTLLTEERRQQETSTGTLQSLVSASPPAPPPPPPSFPSSDELVVERYSLKVYWMEKLLWRLSFAFWCRTHAVS